MSRPPDGNGFAFFAPLIVLAVIYAGVSIAAAFFGRRGNAALRERLQDAAFGVALLATLYTVILLIVSVITLPDLVVDLIRIIVVVGAFFLALLSLLFALFELLIGRTGRTQPLAVADRSADSSSGSANT